jgi:uncharacterized membrane protein
MAPAFAALQPLLPVFLSYVLSFIYLGIYWNNHHHLLHCAPRIKSTIMWANLHLLFWLSLFPVRHRLGRRKSFRSAAFRRLRCGPAPRRDRLLHLQSLILAQIDPGSALATAFRHDFKGKISPILYAAAIGVSFFRPWLAACIYVLVALMWLIPDRRIERTLTARDA